VILGVLGLGVADAAAAPSIINPTGGASATDDLAIVVQPTTQVQIVRHGHSQFAGPAGLDVAIGATVYGAGVAGAVAWTPVAQTGVLGSGTVADPYAITTIVTGGGALVEETVRYVRGRAAIAIEVTVSPPVGAPPIKLYHLIDTNLDNASFAGAYWQPDSASNPPSTTPTVLGVARGPAYELFVAGAPGWDHYYAAVWTGAYAQVAGGGDLGDALDPDPATAAGIGVQWSLGTIAVPTTVTYELSFAAPGAAVCGDGVIAGGEGCDDGEVIDGDGLFERVRDRGGVCVRRGAERVQPGVWRWRDRGQ
jgi:hypothetical protein